MIMIVITFIIAILTSASCYNLDLSFEKPIKEKIIIKLKEQTREVLPEMKGTPIFDYNINRIPYYFVDQEWSNETKTGSCGAATAAMCINWALGKRAINLYDVERIVGNGATTLEQLTEAIKSFSIDVKLVEDNNFEDIVNLVMRPDTILLVFVSPYKLSNYNINEFSHYGSTYVDFDQSILHYILLEGFNYETNYFLVQDSLNNGFNRFYYWSNIKEALVNNKFIIVKRSY